MHGPDALADRLGVQGRHAGHRARSIEPPALVIHGRHHVDHPELRQSEDHRREIAVRRRVEHLAQ
jgi:hypothetical protein